MKPFFVKQTDSPLPPDALEAWLNATAIEAQAAGARVCRYSRRDGHGLVEGWAADMSQVGDQGAPRWRAAEVVPLKPKPAAKAVKATPVAGD